MIVNNNQFRKQEFEKRRVFKKGTSLCNAYSCPIFQNCLLEIKQLQQENARLKDKLKNIKIILNSNHDVEHIYCALSQYLNIFDYELDLEDYLKEN